METVVLLYNDKLRDSEFFNILNKLMHMIFVEQNNLKCYHRMTTVVNIWTISQTEKKKSMETWLHDMGWNDLQKNNYNRFLP